MVSVFYNWKTGKGTKVNGSTTKNTDSGSTNGRTDVYMKVIISKVKEMERGK